MNELHSGSSKTKDGKLKFSVETFYDKNDKLMKTLFITSTEDGATLFKYTGTNSEINDILFYLWLVS